MELEHVSPKEIVVRFRTPGAGSAQAWTDKIKAELTGEENLARVI